MTTVPDKQWRIDNASALEGIRLRFQPYTRWSESWDHDHCAACWAKFAPFDGPDIQHQGHATCEEHPKGARSWWICSTCFGELQKDMDWTAAKP